MFWYLWEYCSKLAMATPPGRFGAAFLEKPVLFLPLILPVQD
jgi:hypothetical protein